MSETNVWEGNIFVVHNHHIMNTNACMNQTIPYTVVHTIFIFIYIYRYSLGSGRYKIILILLFSKDALN